MIGPPDFRWLVYLIIFAILSCLCLVYSARVYFFPQAPSMKFQEPAMNQKPPHLNCITLCDTRGLFFAIFFFGIVSLYNYVMCSFTDPGVLLRHKDSEKLQAEREEKQRLKKMAKAQ
jgi:hypothetical protein